MIIDIDGEEIRNLNHSIADGLATLREAEARYGQPFRMLFKVDERGGMRMHVEPADPSLGAERVPIRAVGRR